MKHRTLAATFDRLATPVAQLVTRLAFGQAFALTGFGKLANLDRTVDFFGSLGIPFPSLQAPLVGAVELLGGILLVLGAGTRAAAGLLVGTMLVALLTAHGADLAAGLRLGAGFDEAAPVPYLVAALWLAAKGGGPLSVDQRWASRAAPGPMPTGLTANA